MRKASIWITVISIVIAIIPIISVLIAIAIANMLGCSVDESGSSTCLTPIGDIGDFLSTMGIFGWLTFFTVPTGLLGLIVAVILFAVSFIPKKQKESDITQVS